MGYPTELSIQTSWVCEKHPVGILWTYPIWTGLSSKTVTALIRKYGCIMLHPLCNSLYKGQVVLSPWSCNPEPLGQGLYSRPHPGKWSSAWGVKHQGHDLCIQHKHQKLGWAAVMMATTSSIWDEERATLPQLHSRGRKSGGKQELPHHETTFGGTE